MPHSSPWPRRPVVRPTPTASWPAPDHRSPTRSRRGSPRTSWRAARAHGHSAIVVTSKIEPLAVATLAHAGLEADAVFGDRWAGGKAQPLRMMRATALVGDHPGDMLAAAEATVTGVGVTSGSSNRDELLAAGAAVVIESLEHFPDWLASTVS